MSVWLRITGHMCAVDRKQVHAVKARPKTKRKTYDAICGAKRVQLIAWPIVDSDDHMTAPWPPYAADATEWGYTRCPDCLALDKSKPQRLALTPLEADHA